jgi:hypothetical protein
MNEGAPHVVRGTPLRSRHVARQWETVTFGEQVLVPASHTRYVCEPPPRSSVAWVQDPEFGTVAMAAPSRKTVTFVEFAPLHDRSACFRPSPTGPHQA